MATRYIGSAVVRVQYVGTYMQSGSERIAYRGSVSDGKGAHWSFENISASGAEQARRGMAADSPDAYDEIAASAVVFASSPEQGRKADWQAQRDVAQAIEQAAQSAMSDDGSYLVRRKR